MWRQAGGTVTAPAIKYKETHYSTTHYSHIMSKIQQNREHIRHPISCACACCRTGVISLYVRTYICVCVQYNTCTRGTCYTLTAIEDDDVSAASANHISSTCRTESLATAPSQSPAQSLPSPESSQVLRWSPLPVVQLHASGQHLARGNITGADEARRSMACSGGLMKFGG